MDNLVAANVRQRPLRTAISTVGVALGVILVVLTVGLAHGMMRETAERQANVSAEITFNPPGDFSPATGQALNLDTAYAKAILEGTPRIKPIDGVAAVSPIAQYLQTSRTGIGFEVVEGVDFATYPSVTQFHLVGGRIPTGNEVVVDSFYAKNKKDIDNQPVRVGGHVLVFGTKMEIVGIYEPEMGARLKMPLDTMQRFVVGGASKASRLLIKVADPAKQEIVAAELRATYPSNPIVLTRDIPSLFSGSIGSLEIFLKTVVGLATVISTLVILLAMYTTIIERTREIGVLKSLGASKGFIISTIEKEAILISAVGVLFGGLVSLLGKIGIERFTTLRIDLEPKWLLISAAIGLISGALGALYPALRAANLDPIKALTYE